MTQSRCSTCDDGTACHCLIRLRLNPGLEPYACGCMGFTGCPDCGRGMQKVERLGMTAALSRMDSLSKE